MIKALILFFILNTSTVFASNYMTIDGIIMQFDDKTIQLKQVNGTIVHVPRSAKKEMKGVKLGKDIISVEVHPGDFMKLNSQFFPKMKNELEAEKKKKALERAKK